MPKITSYRPQLIESYTETIRDCIEQTKFQVIILIDSLNEAQALNNLDWLPIKLNDKVKIIVTTTSASNHIDDCRSDDIVLHNLKKKLSKSSFVHLDQFSEQQWAEVLSYGGGDFYSANVHLQLPDAWKSCSEKIPLQAKVIKVHFRL